MNKFSKILTLLLALVLTVTVFTVVSLAATEEETELVPYTKAIYSLKADDFDVDAYTENQILSYTGRTGEAKIAVQDNGNKYAVMQLNGATGVTAGMWDIDLASPTSCNVKNYPYFMIEFDTMVQSGTFDGASIYARIGTSSLQGFVKETKFSALGLSTSPYNWQHVSIIVKYDGVSSFTQYGFVNGVQKVNSGTLTNDALDFSLARVNQVRIYPTSTSKVGVDNFAITYFPAGFAGDDLTAIANYNYKNGEGYEMPYGNTLTELCDAEIIYPSGTSYSFKADEFAKIFANAPKDSVIKLHNDITLNAGLGFSYEQKFTLDLNGYNIYRMGTAYTDYAAVYNEETGAYEKGEALESPASVSLGGMFVVGANKVNFTVTSSRPGGTLYSVSVTAERLLLDGKVVASNVTATSSSNIFEINHSNAVILLKDVDTYARTVVYDEHGSGTNLSFNVDGGTHVKKVVGTTAMFHLLRGGTHTIKNATIVGNAGYAARVYGYSTYATLTFENCDIVSAHSESQTGETLIFKNCRLESFFNEITGTVRFEGINRFKHNYGAFSYEDGKQLVSSSKTFTYSYANAIVIDPITLLPSLSEAEEHQITYTYLTYNPETDVASVTWKDFDGNIVKTEKLIKGEKAEAPLHALPSVDGWRSTAVIKWLDSNSEEANLIPSSDEEVYTAVRPVIDENTEYISNISDAYLSFSYVAQFHMYFYLPVTEGMERPTLTGAVPSSSYGTVFIKGQEYWLYTWWLSAPSAANDTNFTVNFEIDGVKYTQSFTISALIYAEIVLSSPESDAEALAVANMVRYIKEARIANGKTVGEKFDELIGSEGLYPNLPAYLESYPDDSLDTSAIAPYVDTFTLLISATPCYRVSLSQKAIDLGMTKDNYRLTTKSGVRLDLFDYAKNGKDFDTNNTKIYNLAETFTITVTVPAVKDAETGEVITESFTVSCDYSIGTYIKGASEQNPEANLDLAKASYSFALAAKAYRDSVIDK